MTTPIGGLRLTISPMVLRRAVEEWLSTDISSFDVGAAIVGDSVGKAVFYWKSKSGVLAGFPFAEEVFRLLGCTVEWFVKEGTAMRLENEGVKRVAIGVVSGPIHRILQGERTALEALTRASACASYARLCVNRVPASWKGRVAATRKTTPGHYRLVEKYGAMVGGADPHRYNLSSMVMLKDNHIDAAGSITHAVQRARSLCGFSTKVEVECRSEADAIEACGAGADVVMLDNFTPDRVSVSAPKIKAAFPECIVEVSGGIDESTVARYALPGVDILAIGKITHGPPAIDISLKLQVAVPPRESVAAPSKL